MKSSPYEDVLTREGGLLCCTCVSMFAYVSPRGVNRSKLFAASGIMHAFLI